MNITTVAASIALYLTIGLAQSEPEGVYTILVDGKTVGQERFQAAQADGLITIKSTGDIPLEGSSQKITTQTEIRKGRIERYLLELSKPSGNEKYDLSFGGGKTRVEIEAHGRKTERVKEVSDDAVLLDKHIWHHYRFLLAKYDLPSGGAQRLNVFIPQAAFRQYTAEIEMTKRVSFEFRDKKIQAYRFEILLADTYDVIVITDQEKIPLSIEIPSEKLKAVLE